MGNKSSNGNFGLLLFIFAAAIIGQTNIVKNQDKLMDSMIDHKKPNKSVNEKVPVQNTGQGGILVYLASVPHVKDSLVGKWCQENNQKAGLAKSFIQDRVK